MQLVFSFEDPRMVAGSSELLRTSGAARARQKRPFLLSSGPFSLPALSSALAEVRKGGKLLPEKSRRYQRTNRAVYFSFW
jgi:hypothetical protein